MKDLQIIYAVRGERCKFQPVKSNSSSNQWCALLYLNTIFLYCSGQRNKTKWPFNHRNPWDSLWLGPKVTVLWPQKDQCICVGWSWCDDCYTGPSGSVHQNSEVWIEPFYLITENLSLQYSLWLTLDTCLYTWRMMKDLMMNGFFINSTNVSRTLISLYTGTYIVLFMEKSIDLRNQFWKSRISLFESFWMSKICLQV